jgi:hypothetical protein
MRTRLVAFAVLFVLLFVPIVLVAHPARFVDDLFIAAFVAVFWLVLLGASGASGGSYGRRMGGLSVRPRKQRRFEDSPSNYDYPDA